MIVTKLFEVRDRATCIPCIGVALRVDLGERRKPEDQAEAFLLRRSGFGEDRLIMFGRLEEPTDMTWDPFGHSTTARTVPMAHQYVADHWEELASGAVVDVEYILGERAEPKLSERL